MEKDIYTLIMDGEEPIFLRVYRIDEPQISFRIETSIKEKKYKGFYSERWAFLQLLKAINVKTLCPSKHTYYEPEKENVLFYNVDYSLDCGGVVFKCPADELFKKISEYNSNLPGEQQLLIDVIKQEGF